MLNTVPVERDEVGHWMHPDLDKLFKERESIPNDEFKAWEVKHGIETKSLQFMYEADDALLEIEEARDDCDISFWNPDPPDGYTHMLFIVDTEDGPVAGWYRNKEVSGD